MTIDTPAPAEALSREQLEALNGHTPGPWQFWTSCSWRRFRTASHAVVCEPYVAHDGHPDLSIREADARLIAAAPDLLTTALAALARAEAAEAEVERLREALRAAQAGIVDFRMDHPHVLAVDGLDRAENAITAALTGSPS